jgi:hypothetical protein
MERRQQVLRTRQAATMRGEDSIGAADHVRGARVDLWDAWTYAGGRDAR